MMKSSRLRFSRLLFVLAPLVAGAVACNVDADIAKAPASAAPRDDAGAGEATATGADPTNDPTGDASRDGGGPGTTPPASSAWQTTKAVPGGVVVAGSAGTPAARTLWPLAVFGDGEPTACESRSVASGAHTCTVSRCTASSQSAKTPPHAGAIDFGGLAIISPNAWGLYGSPATSPAWSPGTTLAIQAAGGTIPAFAGSIAVPTDLTVTSPAGGAPDETHPLPSPLSKSAGLHVAWLPGGAASEVVQVAISEAYGASRPMYQYAIACLAPRADGALDVPAAALSELSEIPPAAGGPQVMVSVETTTERILTPGTYRVRLLGLGRGVSMTATGQIVP